MCLSQLQVIQGGTCWYNAAGVQWKQLRKVASASICYIHTVSYLHVLHKIEVTRLTDISGSPLATDKCVQVQI